MQNEGEQSVEDILRSIKKVISRDDEIGAHGGSVPSFGASRSFGQREAFARGGPSEPPVVANSYAPLSHSTGDNDDVYDLGNLPGSSDAVEDVPPAALPAAFAMAERIRSELETEAADEIVAEKKEGEIGGIGFADKAESKQENEAAAPPEAAPRAAAYGGSARATPSVEEGLVAGAAVAAMRDRIAALSSLSAAAPKAEAAPGPLEEVVREMLRPMLKEWLDGNLQNIIERMVEAEIARITGRR